jgi:DNA-binding LacI/PurR family transcriptional regulator
MNKLPLYKQIQQTIRRKIVSGDLRPKDRVPSEQEIMDEYMVSKITVKNALSALADEGLIVRIQGKGTFVAAHAAAAETAARMKPGGSPSGSTEFVGFIIPTMKTKVIRKLVEHVEYFLKESGYQLVLHITRESSVAESHAIRDLTASPHVRGLIVFPTEDETYSEALLRLSLDKFPFVFIDRYLRNIDTYRITSDNFGGVYETVSMLLGRGHRRIALISPDNTNTSIEDRTSGFERAYIEQQIPIDKGLWCHVPIDILRTGDPQSYVADFLHKHPDISVAFTMTAEMANLTHQALRGKDMTNPDVQVVSFDDPDLPDIPYISQDEREMARSAVELLVRQFDGEYEPRKVEVPVSLEHMRGAV